MDSLVRGRVWPDGSFVLWRRSVDSEADPQLAPPIGLSKVANSHKKSQDFTERLQRGTSGITSYGQRMVTNAAYLLQKIHGGARLSFLTCTLPGTPELTIRIAEEWAEITRIFYQSLKRHLVKNGLGPEVVGVTEIQPERFRKTGGMPLHLHVVFQGAVSDYQWRFRPAHLTRLWKRAVTARVPDCGEFSFASACNVQSVKNNAAGYLGKYMSKGTDDICAILDDDPELIDVIPRSWYHLSSEARDMVKMNMVEGERVGLTMEKWMQWDDELASPFKYKLEVRLKDRQGYVVKSFWVGELEAHWKRRVGLPVAPHEIARV